MVTRWVVAAIRASSPFGDVENIRPVFTQRQIARSAPIDIGWMTVSR
jgi:hypothetical protein